MIEGALTAIRRGKLSAPVKYLKENLPHLFDGSKRILDYGCGRGEDAEIIGCEKWDPEWFYEPYPNGKFDVILCTYVLCVVHPKVQRSICEDIQISLKDDGVAYISVRDDIKTKKPGRGCEQRPVDLQGNAITEFAKKSGGFRIYKMLKYGSVQAVGPCDTHGLKQIMELWSRT
jgi:SAM-dependent methyltransferase